MAKLSKSYKENRLNISTRLRVKESFDVIERVLSVAGREVVFFYIDGFTKDAEMLRIMQYLLSQKGLGSAGELLLKLPYVEVEASCDEDEIVRAVLSGQTAIFSQALNYFMEKSVKKHKNRAYIAVSDNLSRVKAYEFAKELGLEIVGQSGYVDDAAHELADCDIDTIICSQKLYDGEAKQLYHKLPKAVKNQCKFYVISPSKNRTLRLSQISHSAIVSKYDVIQKTLDYVAIPKNLKAYNLFKDALDITLSNPDALFDITKKVYSHLATIHNTDVRNIECNMRTAKKHSLLHCNPDIVNEVFGDFPDGESPSLSVYLSMLTTYILQKTSR